jgi:hypothetical protein
MDFGGLNIMSFDEQNLFDEFLEFKDGIFHDKLLFELIKKNLEGEFRSRFFFQEYVAYLDYGKELTEDSSYTPNDGHVEYQQAYIECITKYYKKIIRNFINLFNEQENLRISSIS